MNTKHISGTGEIHGFSKDMDSTYINNSKIWSEEKELEVFLSQHYVVSASVRYEEISSDCYVKAFVIIITVHEKCLWTEAMK